MSKNIHRSVFQLRDLLFVSVHCQLELTSRQLRTIQKHRFLLQDVLDHLELSGELLIGS